MKETSNNELIRVLSRRASNFVVKSVPFESEGTVLLVLAGVLKFSGTHGCPVNGLLVIYNAYWRGGFGYGVVISHICRGYGKSASLFAPDNFVRKFCTIFARSLYELHRNLSPMYEWNSEERKMKKCLIVGKVADETIRPNVHSEEMRMTVINFIQTLFTQFGTEVFPFGLFSLKTYLPDGDIDLTAISDY
ncbi:unnamed protein product [Fraxinus pennsylvanica]|uniref:Polymerase nucleotidyl transferase domain-containing protein n=1 Tax=Fraxinus pennsylvanica TaxID=56036 RepID=A0AAD1Z3Q8_9LAMI|nr:unnamed protein product [Fraxinus pennsylvanica]